MTVLTAEVNTLFCAMVRMVGRKMQQAQTARDPQAAAEKCKEGMRAVRALYDLCRDDFEQASARERAARRWATP